jgi:hypothetical protein
VLVEVTSAEEIKLSAASCRPTVAVRVALATLRTASKETDKVPSKAAVSWVYVPAATEAVKFAYAVAANRFIGPISSIMVSVLVTVPVC